MSAQVFHCSFCAKADTEVKKLIAGPHALICDECVLVCLDIMISRPPANNVQPLVEPSAEAAA